MFFFSSTRARGMAAAVACLALVPAHANAATSQPSVVSANADDHIPQLVSSAQDGRCSTSNPHVDAITTLDGTGYAAGLFDCVRESDGKLHTGLTNIVAFDLASGAVQPLKVTLPTGAAGQVWALAADRASESLFVGGDFKTVNGASRSGLVKLDATTGEVRSGFTPYFSTGKVKDLELVTVAGRQRLFVAGGQAKKLVSVDPASGKDDGFLKFTAPGIADVIRDSDGNAAWGGVAVYQIAVDPSGTHLAATGNFANVEGQPRRGFFMLDLANGNVGFGGDGSTLSSWYYPGFAKDCASEHARRIAYLQGVDWSPDGRYLTVTATGQIPESPSQVWHEWNTDAEKQQSTVCDAVGRFELDNPRQPQWVNYTGGDSVWSVQDTGTAVYVQGHFKWLDNPDGYGSLGVGDKGDPAGQYSYPAARRAGIGAIDPTTGRAISTWAPAVPTSMGGKALVATPAGLWVGSNAKKFGKEAHYGLAFAPLSK